MGRTTSEFKFKAAQRKPQPVPNTAITSMALRGFCRGLRCAPTDDAMAKARWSTEAMVKPARTAFERYGEMMHERPFLTNAVTSGLLCGLGDVLAQSVEKRAREDRTEQPPFNAIRTMRMGVYGTFFCGPLMTCWYQALNTLDSALRVSYEPVIKWLPWWYRVVPGSSPQRLLAIKVVADSLLFQAPFLTLYFGVMGMLEGLSPAKIFTKMKESFHQAWALSVLVWTPVQCVNLFYVPAAWQPAVVSTVNVGWKTTLSLLNQYHERSSEGEKESAANEALVASLEAENSALREQVTALLAQNDALQQQLHLRWWTPLTHWWRSPRTSA